MELNPGQEIILTWYDILNTALIMQNTEETVRHHNSQSDKIECGYIEKQLKNY